MILSLLFTLMIDTIPGYTVVPKNMWEHNVDLVSRTVINRQYQKQEDPKGPLVMVNGKVFIGRIDTIPVQKIIFLTPSESLSETISSIGIKESASKGIVFITSK